MPALSRRALFLLVLVFLAAFALRLFRLDAQSIWWDEGISLHLATSSLAEIVRDRLDNIHPPLYFIILKGWLNLTGVSAFTGRYLSALAALLQVPLVFAFVRAVFGQSSGARATIPPQDRPFPWIAAALMVVFPLSIIYGQEIRVYAFLPLIYIGLLWLGHRLTNSPQLDRRTLVVVGLIAWLGLHLHYIAIFGVAYVALWGAVTFMRRGRWDQLAQWVVVFLFVGLASLPWFVAMIGNWASVQAEAAAGTFATEPVPLLFLFSQVWAFQLTGLAGALGTPLVRILAALTAGVFAVLLALRLLPWEMPDELRRLHHQQGTRHVLRLLAHWAIPLGLALVVWSLRSFSHPRYVTMYTIAFVPLAAALVWPARRRLTQSVAALLLALLVFLNLWGLGRYFFNPATAKDDMRAVAEYLTDVAGPDDIILIPDTDWSLPFEYTGPATIVMGTLGDSPAALPDALSVALVCEPGPAPGATCPTPLTVYAIDYVRGTRDWQRRLPFELERRGALLETSRFDDLLVHHYRIDRPAVDLPPCPEAEQSPLSFGPVTLASSWVEQGADSNTAVTVALCWRPGATTADAYSAAIALSDPLTGEQVGQASIALLDETGRPTTAWVAGVPVTTYHVVPLQPGTPPLRYDAAVSVFAPTSDGIVPVEIVGPGGQGAGRQAALGKSTLGVPLPGVDNPYGVDEPPRLDPAEALTEGVLLEGAVVGGGQYRPGQTVRVSLLWRRDDTALAAFAPELHLDQGGQSLAVNADEPAQGRYPAADWSPGELVREVRDLRLPASADGEVDVVLRVGPERRLLGTLSVSGEDVLLAPPEMGQIVEVAFGDVAELVGFAVEETRPAATDELPVTLLWRSRVNGAATDYAVFVHIVDGQGTLIGQHDGLPGGGKRPTSAWLVGEYILDPHPVTFRDPSYTGPATIRVGLYDPATGQRLLTSDGADAFTLPIALDVGTQP